MTNDDMVVLLVGVAAVWAVIEFGVRWIIGATRHASVENEDEHRA
jgi:hypothetical protein